MVTLFFNNSSLYNEILRVSDSDSKYAVIFLFQNNKNDISALYLHIQFMHEYLHVQRWFKHEGNVCPIFVFCNTM